MNIFSLKTIYTSLLTNPIGYWVQHLQYMFGPINQNPRGYGALQVENNQDFTIIVSW